MPDLSDQDLVRRILQRDARALETLFDRYREPIRRHLEKIVRDDDASQDLSQEVFLRVWTRAHQWDHRGPFRAWLYRIATNLALNHLRSVSRRRERPLDCAGEGAEDDQMMPPAWLVDDAAPPPDVALELAERHQHMVRLVGRLPPDKREVLHLVHDLEMSLRDVAEKLGVPEGTVKSRLFYARRRLAHGWQELDID